MLAKIGPRMNRMTRLPVARSSSITSAPRMSDGIRSGVNWMRLNLRSTASDSFLISSVLARPGHAAQQAVPAGEEGDQDLADDPLLADDDLGQLALETAGQLGDAFDRNRRRVTLGEMKAALGHGHE